MLRSVSQRPYRSIPKFFQFLCQQSTLTIWYFEIYCQQETSNAKTPWGLWLYNSKQCNNIFCSFYRSDAWGWQTAVLWGLLPQNDLGEGIWVVEIFRSQMRVSGLCQKRELKVKGFAWADISFCFFLLLLRFSHAKQYAPSAQWFAAPVALPLFLAYLFQLLLGKSLPVTLSVSQSLVECLKCVCFWKGIYNDCPGSPLMVASGKKRTVWLIPSPHFVLLLYIIEHSNAFKISYLFH